MTTFTPINKSSTPTWSSISKTVIGTITASPGLYYGFGAFTYSGGEITTPGHPPIYTAVSKNSTTFTPINKS